MRKRAVVIIEAKEGYEWSWPRSERVWYRFKVEKLKGDYKVEEVREGYKNGAGFEGVGGARYVIYKIKIYKDFVGRIIQTAEYAYSKYKKEEVLFDNIAEKKEEKLKEYLKAIKIAKKLDHTLIIRFDSELFTLEDFFNFLKNEVGTSEIYPIDVKKEYEDLGLFSQVWWYEVTCEAKNFILKYKNGYYGKEAYKKVDEVLKKYEDLLREKVSRDGN
jgi:hypothetical protein